MIHPRETRTGHTFWYPVHFRSFDSERPIEYILHRQLLMPPDYALRLFVRKSGEYAYDSGEGEESHE